MFLYNLLVFKLFLFNFQLEFSSILRGFFFFLAEAPGVALRLRERYLCSSGVRGGQAGFGRGQLAESCARCGAAWRVVASSSCCSLLVAFSNATAMQIWSLADQKLVSRRKAGRQVRLR